MEITISDRLKKHPDLAARAEDERGLVDHLLSFAFDQISWDVAQDPHGRNLLKLRLVDSTSGNEGSRTFIADELLKPAHFEKKLISLRDAALKIGKWKNALISLYDKVREWSRAFDDQIAIDEIQIERNERLSGEYHAPQLVIKHGDIEMTFMPFARWVVASDGRVEIVCEESEYSLLYLEEFNTWDIIEKPFMPMTMTLSKRFDEAAFLAIVKDAMNVQPA